MALAGESELFRVLGKIHGQPAPRPAFRSVLPYEVQLEDGTDGRYELDYEWEQEPGDAPVVTVTAVRVVFDRTELSVPVSAFPQKWLRDREWEISETITADLADAAVASREDR